MKRHKKSASNGKSSRRGHLGQSQRKDTSLDSSSDKDHEENGHTQDQYSDRRQLAKNTVISIDDPIRMYLMQMGDISMLSREEELQAAQRIEMTQQRYRTHLLASDYVLRGATDRITHSHVDRYLLHKSTRSLRRFIIYFAS